MFHITLHISKELVVISELDTYEYMTASVEYV